MRNPILATLIAASLGMSTAVPEAWADRPGRHPVLEDDPAIVESDSFRVGHPDVRWRQDAIQARERGDLDAAFTRFKRAARYGDKLSQAMVAEMHWTGTGAPHDRALAYAWMDLAAERQNRDFLLKREFYWSRLSATERERALELGIDVYAQFGDAVAKPRQARAMARVKGGITGSRVGWTGFMKSIPYRQAAEGLPLDSTVFFADRYWDEARYWDWQDEWLRQGTRGVVDVLPLQSDEPDEPEGRYPRSGADAEPTAKGG